MTIYSPGNSKYEGGSFWPINNPDIISYDAEVDEKEKAKLGECYTIQVKSSQKEGSLFKKHFLLFRKFQGLFGKGESVFLKESCHKSLPD